MVDTKKSLSERITLEDDTWCQMDNEMFVPMKVLVDEEPVGYLVVCWETYECRENPYRKDSYPNQAVLAALKEGRGLKFVAK